MGEVTLSHTPHSQSSCYGCEPITCNIKSKWLVWPERCGYYLALGISVHTLKEQSVSHSVSCEGRTHRYSVSVNVVVLMTSNCWTWVEPHSVDLRATLPGSMSFQSLKEKHYPEIPPCLHTYTYTHTKHIFNRTTGRKSDTWMTENFQNKTTVDSQLGFTSQKRLIMYPSHPGSKHKK